MTFPRIQNSKTTIFNTFGGDALNKIQELFGGINIAATDATNKPLIDTDFRFKSNRLILLDADQASEVRFVLPTLSSNVSITMPTSMLTSEANELLFSKTTQTIINKTIAAGSNSISGLTNTNIGTNAFIDWTKISKVGSNLSDISTVNLSGLANNYSIKWDSTAGQWIPYDVGTAIGETNTGTNLGTGAGVFKDKLGVSLRFHSLAALNSSTSVALDTVNNKINIGVSDATTALKGAVQLATSAQTTAGLAVQASDTRLLDSRTPTSHAVSHKNLGTDIIKVNELAAPTANITTCNATATTNGLAPVLPNNSNLFWNGVGGWTEPIGTGAGASGTGSVIRGRSTQSAVAGTTVYTISHGMSVTPTSYIVQPQSTDALGEFTVSASSTTLTLTYQLAPRVSAANNLIWSWVVFDSGNGGSLGEANTYSSVGTGVPFTKTKTGIDLPFKSLFAGSNKISIVGNTNDVSFDVNQANLSIAYSQLTGVPTTYTPSTHASTHHSGGTDVLALASIAGSIGDAKITDLAYTKLTAVPTSFAPIAHKNNHKAGGTDAFAKGDVLAGAVRYLDEATGPGTDSRRQWMEIGSAIVNYWSNETIPTSRELINNTSPQTLTNKTYNLTNNTLTDTGAVSGGIPIHNGTKYVTTAKGADGSFLGVSGGSVGYYTPATGSGGILPDGSAIPTSGRWGALWGGTIAGSGILVFPSNTYDTLIYSVPSPTETTTDITTQAIDDTIAELKSTGIFTRQSNCVFRVKWSMKQTSSAVIMIGLTSGAIPTGTSHDNPLNNLHGIMLTCSQDIETNYQISRNSGSVTQTKVATTIAANTTATHTLEIDMNSTNAIITLDGGTPFTYTTIIPSLTMKLNFYVHVETIGAGARGISIYRAQVTSL